MSTLKLAAATAAQFIADANKVPVIFQYVYAHNPRNQAAGRQGRSAGFRQGVRNLAYVPPANQPGNPQREYVGGPVKYFDIGRTGWRSFLPENIRSLTAWWSEEAQAFVGTREEAGLDALAPFAERATGPTPNLTADRQARLDARAAQTASRQRRRNDERARELKARQSRRVINKVNSRNG